MGLNAKHHPCRDADSSDARTYSFIVKVWLEEAAEETEEPTWRGHITHVPSGDRQYVQTLDDIAAFIEPYLLQLGARSGLRDRRTWRRRPST